MVEDVTMPVVTGSLDVADGQDFRTLLPLTGNEKLELHLFTLVREKYNTLKDKLIH